MSWAARRRLIIILIILVVVCGIAFYFVSPFIFKAPTCTDGKQDGTETGIDCGGTMCTNLCTDEVKVPTILWARSFAVADNVYNAVAYVQNKNDAATRSIAYEFRLYDPNGVYITRVDGTAEIPPLGNYAIVETGIAVGNTTVGNTTFEFSQTPALWERLSSDAEKFSVLTSNLKLDTTGTVPRLSATINNPSPTATLNNTVVDAILYDANDNAVNASQTVVPILAPGQSLPIYFTWPTEFPTPVVRYELLPIIDVFNSK